MSSHIEDTLPGSEFLVTPSPSILDDSSTYDSFFGIMQPSSSINNKSFATDEDFSQIHDTPAQPWRNLTTHIIYRIQHMKKVKTKSGGDALILYLYSKDATIPSIHWASNLLASELLTLKEISNLYVRSTGLKKSQTGRNYYGFQLIQKLN